MNWSRRAMLVAAVALAFSATEAYAGGHGGTKRNGTIKVTNNSTQTVLFTTNTNSAAIQAAYTAKSISQFQAAGGVVLSPGASTSFSVKAGTYSIGAVDEAQIDTTTTTATPIATTTVVVNGGQTKTVFIVNSTVTPPTTPPTTTGASDITLLDP